MSIPPPGPLSYEGVVAASSYHRTFPPLSSYNKFPTVTMWADTSALNGYMSLSPGTWVRVGGAIPDVYSITGDSGSIVVSDAAGNVNIIGTSAQGLSFVGSSHTLTGTVANASSSQKGVASFNATNFTATAGVITSANFTVTAGTNLSGGGAITLGGSTSLALVAKPSLNSITIVNAPVDPTDGANKAYVDLIAAGFTYEAPVVCATTANLTAIYVNGAAGVGATLTNSGTQAAFSVDGISPVVTNRVLVKNQTTTFQNGIYTVTTVGTGATNWVLTRSTDYDQTTEIQPGDIVPVLTGTVNGDTFWIQTATVTAIGTDPLLFSEFGGGATVFPTQSGTATPATGAITINGSGIVNTSASGGTITINAPSVTNHCVLLGGSANAITSLTNGTTGQVLTAVTGSDPVWSATSTTTFLQATRSTNTARVTGSGANYTVVFDNIVTQTGGSNYNASTGVYTIPATGIYAISSIVAYDGSIANSGTYALSIIAGASNGVMATGVSVEATSPACVQVQGRFSLTAGDSVSIVIQLNGASVPGNRIAILGSSSPYITSLMIQHL